MCAAVVYTRSRSCSLSLYTSTGSNESCIRTPLKFEVDGLKDLCKRNPNIPNSRYSNQPKL